MSKATSSSMPWDSKPGPGAAQAAALASNAQRLADAASKPLPAPRTSSDIEKALLTTLKKDPARQLAYVQEHISATALRRFYKRCPLGPDLLARFIHISAALADEDSQRAEE